MHTYCTEGITGYKGSEVADGNGGGRGYANRNGVERIKQTQDGNGDGSGNGD